MSRSKRTFKDRFAERGHGFAIRVSRENATALARQAKELGLTPYFAASELVRISAQENMLKAVLGDSYNTGQRGARA